MKQKRTIFFLISVVTTIPVIAEVKLDGTLGNSDAVAGPNYDIKTQYGKQSGGNLFHSFKYFDVNSGETARFRTNNDTKNVIARVTGGSTSHIDGTIKVDGSNTNLWLLNPKGVIFGKGVALDINGAFHVGAGKSISFGSNEEFSANFTAGETLSSKDPIGFAFGATPSNASIVFNEVVLNTSTLNKLYIAAPSIELLNSQLNFQNSEIFLHGIQTGVSALDPRNSERGNGNILLSGSTISVSDTNGKGIWINGNNSEIKRSNLILGGSVNKSIIDLKAHAITLKRSTISAQNILPGEHEGKIRIDANSLAVSSGSEIRTNGLDHAEGAIDIDSQSIAIDQSKVETISHNRSADIDLNGNELQIRNSAYIHSSGANSVSGAIKIRGQNIIVQSSIVGSEGAGGKTGTVQLAANRIALQDGAEVFVDAKTGAANAGIRLDANEVLIDSSNVRAIADNGESSGIRIAATSQVSIIGNAQIETISSGAGNDITISSENVRMTDSSAIRSTNVANNGGNNISINATKKIEIDGNLEKLVRVETLVGSDSRSAQAGNITIAGEDIDAKGLAISSRANGNNSAGNVFIEGKNSIALRDGSVSIATEKTGNGEIRMSSKKGTIENSSIVVVEKGNAVNDRVIYQFANAPLANPSVPVKRDPVQISKETEIEIEKTTKTNALVVADAPPRVIRLKASDEKQRIKTCSGDVVSGETLSQVHDVSSWLDYPGEYTLRKTNTSGVNKLSRGKAMNVQTAFYTQGTC